MPVPRDKLNDGFADRCLQRLEPVWRYVKASVSSFHDAEDLTQEVFVQACASRAQFTGGDIDAWLYQIARSKVAMYYRKKSVERRSQKAIVERNGAAPASVAETAWSEDPQAVEAALNSLDEDEREALRLKFAHSYSNIEIARLLKVEPAYLGVIVYRALRKLRRKLEGTRA